MKLFIIGITLMVLCAACSKQLSRQPTDQITGSTVYASVSDVNMAVLGVYANWDEEYFTRIASEVADECRIGSLNAGIGLTGSGQNLFRWAFTSNDVEILQPWTNGYQVINQVNLILNALPNVPAAGDSLEKQQLKGELLAIRAFQHFDLYRAYAYSGIFDSAAPAVPYITGTNIYNLPSRPTTAIFFAQLKGDLAAAAPLMSNNKGINRMGLTALYALEARIALYTNDWATAAGRATQVIQSIPLASMANFPSIWTDQGTAEEIFTLLRTNQSAIRPGDLWYNIPFGVYLFNPSKTLMNLYDTVNDVRYHSYFATDSSLVSTGQLPDIIVKYAGTTGEQNLNNLKVFRTGEMYLIRAEAYARSGNLAAASADLNTLRGQRIAGYQPVSFSGSVDLLAAILQERYKELPYEGHRLYDLKREGMSVVRQSADLPPGVTENTLLPSSIYYYIPIPQTEVEANPNILPNNPGW